MSRVLSETWGPRDGLFAHNPTQPYNAAFHRPTHMRHLPNNSQRITVATVIFILCGLLSTGRVITEAPTPRPDSVARRSDQRFAALKAALPPRGIVGYVGDRGNLADYYLAQYALAPIVVDNSPNHPFVVGNFPTTPVPSTLNLQLLKDFGNGVLLLANKDTQ